MAAKKRLPIPERSLRKFEIAHFVPSKRNTPKTQNQKKFRKSALPARWRTHFIPEWRNIAVGIEVFMNRDKFARMPGAPRNAGRIVHEWTRMNTNQTHSFLISFVWIRVHSWMDRLSFSHLPLGVLTNLTRRSASLLRGGRRDATKCNILQHSPDSKIQTFCQISSYNPQRFIVLHDVEIDHGIAKRTQ